MNWIADNMGVTVAALIVLIAVLVFATGRKQEQQRAAFMEACTQDHKPYECAVMWGQTPESRQMEELARNIAISSAGASIGVGMAAGRR